MKRLTQKTRDDIANYLQDVANACRMHCDAMIEPGPITAEQRSDILDGIIISEDKLREARLLLEAIQ